MLSSAMAKTPTAIDSELATEIERQFANTCKSMAHLRASRDETRAICQQRGDAHLMLSNFGSRGREHLVAGLVSYERYADFAGATRQFAGTADGFEFYDDILAAARRGEMASLQPKLPLRDVLEATLCLVLADDRARLSRLAGPELEQLFVLPESVGAKFDRVWAWFTYALLLLARGSPPRELAGQVHPVRPKDVIAGYDALLREAMRGDAAAFEAQRRVLEEAYPGRGKGARSPTINWWGAGRIGQAMTFDVIGTVIARLAVLDGLDVQVDSALYPAEFIHRA
jgi:hypothetical protein